MASRHSHQMPESAADVSIYVRDALGAADLDFIRSCSLSSQPADDPPAHFVVGEGDGGHP